MCANGPWYDVLTRVGQSCSRKLKPFDDYDTQPCVNVKCERKGCGMVLKPCYFSVGFESTFTLLFQNQKFSQLTLKLF
jgi:hypothetical protein